MTDPNPYTPSSQGDLPRQAGSQQRSRLKRFMIGSLIAASLPLLLGGYGLSQFWAYTVSLPPGTARCGNGALGPLFLVLFVAPLFGMLGGSLAAALPDRGAGNVIVEIGAHALAGEQVRPTALVFAYCTACKKEVALVEVDCRCPLCGWPIG